MKNLSNKLAAKQGGFTLIELIIVIIIIGILAAAATIKMGNVTDAANKATNKAVSGMVKSAWAAAYAVKKAAPTLAEVATQTGEPTCTAATGSLSCPVSWLSTTNAAGNLIVDIPDLTTSAGIACHTTADCE